MELSPRPLKRSVRPVTMESRSSPFPEEMNCDSEKIQELLRHFRSVTVIEDDADIESAMLIARR
jgi:hypothetical protein